MFISDSSRIFLTAAVSTMQFQEAVIVFATLAIPNSYMDFYIVSAVFYAEENEYVTMASLQHNKAASQ
jgi:hypothetical protein